MRRIVHRIRQQNKHLFRQPVRMKQMNIRRHHKGLFHDYNNIIMSNTDIHTLRMYAYTISLYPPARISSQGLNIEIENAQRPSEYNSESHITMPIYYRRPDNRNTVYRESTKAAAETDLASSTDSKCW